jgi:hypothetical protein
MKKLEELPENFQISEKKLSEKIVARPVML